MRESYRDVGKEHSKERGEVASAEALQREVSWHAPGSAGTRWAEGREGSGRRPQRGVGAGAWGVLEATVRVWV